jgi:(1->4)-alpha-D-glucan 1-alpha-D-glucosylmutase
MSAEWIATYRLQLHAGFPLGAAERILPYLKDLGISHVYLSPCLQAVPGSQHGYDVADPTRISGDLGGEPAWRKFVAATRALGLRVLLDIVPNHMSASHHNAWWDDVLAHGPYSAHVEYFDFKMLAQEAFRVHLCFLAQPYGASIEAGEIRIGVEEGRLRLRHYDNSWPVNPAAWGLILGLEHVCFETLRRLQEAPLEGERDAARYQEACRQAQALLQQAARQGTLAAAVDRASADFNLLDAVIQRQFYSLHYWKLAGELNNYRRFFDVGNLSGIRIEVPEVLEATHRRIEAMIAAGDIDGLRVDHPDGLRRPVEYFKRLREWLPEGRIYIEKILENDEKVPQDWPIDGTVGYDFLAKVNRLWMDDQKMDVLTATYADFTAHSVNLNRLIREKKRAIIESTFSADQDRLAALALTIARAERQTRDLSPRQLREALARLLVALPVYRTYRRWHTLHEQDRRIFSEAVQSARMGSTDIDAAVYDFLLALFTKPELSEFEADFLARWQQLTPAVMAKGVEDTTFYIFDRLVSSNEVGSSPSLIGISPDRFHEYCHYLSECWPRAMLSTSTHDTKRSEDVRTRVSVLSEIPERWAEALHLWSTLNAAAWQNHTPDRHAEYLLYQTLIGAWPISRDRCWDYMLKACREAKINTSWHEPNVRYEESLRGFVDGVFQSAEFIAALERFVAPLITPGRINSLAQTLIKLVAPGLPDFYQGSEFWDLSLVDPDNRRPVDFEARATGLRRARALSAREALAEWEQGMPKLWLMQRVLELRRERADCFAPSSKYQPLVAQGSHLGRLLAFRRGENLIAVVPRFTLSLNGEWGDTQLPLPSGSWRNHFSGQLLQREMDPAVQFREFPVALLLREASG